MVQKNHQMGETFPRLLIVIGSNRWDFWELFVWFIEDKKAGKTRGNLVRIENTIALGFVRTLSLDSVSEPASHNISFSVRKCLSKRFWWIRPWNDWCTLEFIVRRSETRPKCYVQKELLKATGRIKGD